MKRIVIKLAIDENLAWFEALSPRARANLIRKLLKSINPAQVFEILNDNDFTFSPQTQEQVENHQSSNDSDIELNVELNELTL